MPDHDINKAINEAIAARLNQMGFLVGRADGKPVASYGGPEPISLQEPKASEGGSMSPENYDRARPDENHFTTEVEKELGHVELPPTYDWVTQVKAPPGSASLTLPPAGWAVKPLEWEGEDYPKAGDYRIGSTFGQGPKAFMLSRGSTLLGWHDTESEAKAAAQADYERRILSALTLPPAGAREAARVLLEALPDAALPYASEWNSAGNAIASKRPDDTTDGLDALRDALRALAAPPGSASLTPLTAGAPREAVPPLMRQGRLSELERELELARARIRVLERALDDKHHLLVAQTQVSDQQADLNQRLHRRVQALEGPWQGRVHAAETAAHLAQQDRDRERVRALIAVSCLRDAQHRLEMLKSKDPSVMGLGALIVYALDRIRKVSG